MKTTIVIYGQVPSNLKLKKACTPVNNGCTINEYDTKERIEIHFKTKKDAIQALSGAYRQLKLNNLDWQQNSGLYLYADCITYGRSRAVITTRCAKLDGLDVHYRSIRDNNALNVNMTMINR